MGSCQSKFVVHEAMNSLNCVTNLKIHFRETALEMLILKYGGNC